MLQGENTRFLDPTSLLAFHILRMMIGFKVHTKKVTKWVCCQLFSGNWKILFISIRIVSWQGFLGKLILLFSLTHQLISVNIRVFSAWTISETFIKLIFLGKTWVAIVEFEFTLITPLNPKWFAIVQKIHFLIMFHLKSFENNNEY